MQAKFCHNGLVLCKLAPDSEGSKDLENDFFLANNDDEPHTSLAIDCLVIVIGSHVTYKYSLNVHFIFMGKEGQPLTLNLDVLHTDNAPNTVHSLELL